MRSMPISYYTAYEYRPSIQQWITNCGVETDEDTVIQWLEDVGPEIGAENICIVHTYATVALDVTKDLLRGMAYRYAARADTWADVPFWLVDYAPDWVQDAAYDDYIGRSHKEYEV